MKSTTLHRSSLTKERMTALERSRLINMDMNDIPQYRQHETSNKTIPVSVGKGIVPMGTLSTILREAGVTRHDLQMFLNDN